MITLSSDFGSPYPAAMRAVICRESDARIVDVSHDFPRQDVRAAAFWLREILPEFPPATHCVVVDPGVGTDRAALAIEAGEHVLVGPDNGVLAPVARALDDGDGPTVYEIPIDDPASTTFHGRDVFAPATARVHDAGPPATIDEYDRVESWVDLEFPDPTPVEGGVNGEIIAVDDFGNAITTIGGDALVEHVGEAVTVNGVWAPARRTYAAVDPDNRVVTIGSHGNVELAVNRGRGDDRFSVSPGSRVRLRWT
ncbi:MAG: S-adenosyl-l-methionine hydroxide adenosyltransferase family protein [Halococcoides sp.]